MVSVSQLSIFSTDGKPFKTLLNKYSKGFKENDELDLKKQYKVIDLKQLSRKLKVHHELPDRGLNQILNYIVTESKKPENKDKTLKEILNGADIVCYRRTLKFLGITPYLEKNPKFAIEKFQGVFFLKEVGEFSADDYDDGGDGIRFEHTIFAYPGTVPYCVDKITVQDKMVTTLLLNFTDKEGLGEVKVFAQAQVDGLDAGKCVEAKASKELSSYDTGFTERTIEWWIQSKLAGVQTIFHGVKSGTVINKIKKINVEDLDGMCNFWKGEVCLGTIHAILYHLLAEYDRFSKEINGNIKSSVQLQLAIRGYGEMKHAQLEERKFVDILTPEFRSHFEGK